MSEVVCPYCYQTFLKQNNLNRHLKNSCPVLKASEAMSDLSVTRMGRTAEREEGQGARKKSKSREAMLQTSRNRQPQSLLKEC